MRICKIDDCENKVKTRGWCNKHYIRWRIHGDPNIVLREQNGYKNHNLYTVWCNMKARCYNKNDKDYKYYGGRDITVCNEWKNNSKAFIEWALPLWKKGLQIDRKNNEGNYEPSNCKFVTHKENMQNQGLLRSNNTSGYRGVSFNGKWVARIMINNKNRYLGSFDSARLAALRWDVEAYLTDGRPRNLF